jgi:hypothetical protein
MNQNSAQMFCYGQSTIGLINRPGGLPDEPASLINQSGASFTFNPVSGQQNLNVTASVVNTGTNTVMNLLGPTTIVGRNTGNSLLLTNTAGATLNYSANVNVDFDSGRTIPGGNLNNTGGTINGFFQRQSHTLRRRPKQQRDDQSLQHCLDHHRRP